MKPRTNIGIGVITSDAVAYSAWAEGFKLRVAASIQQWLGQAGYEAGKLLRSLRDKADQWWYFLNHPEVPPDNNLAERRTESEPQASLRLAVTKRKVSGGSRSFAKHARSALQRFAIARRLAQCSANLSP